eukprot:7381201-Prymnesium_polylepis.1
MVPLLIDFPIEYSVRANVATRDLHLIQCGEGSEERGILGMAQCNGRLVSIRRGVVPAHPCDHCEAIRQLGNLGVGRIEKSSLGARYHLRAKRQ